METRRRLKMSTPHEIRRALARIANMVLNDEIDPKRANTVMYAANSILSAIRVDEQEKKIDELERLMKENTE